MNKKNIIITILIIVIILLLGALIIVLSQKNESENNRLDIESTDQATNEIEEDSIPEELSDEVQKLIDSIALYTAISGSMDKDQIIFWTLMQHIETNETSTQEENGLYAYTVSKEKLENYLAFFAKEKELTQILNYQNDASVNFNNYQITEENDNYIIRVGGHGLSTTKVDFIDKKIENNKYILTYRSTCSEDKTFETITTGNVTITLTYSKEKEQYFLENATFEKLLDEYSCYWS